MSKPILNNKNENYCSYRLHNECKQPKYGVDIIMSKFNTPKSIINIIKYYQMCTK